jgi:hypothetical protein
VGVGAPPPGLMIGVGGSSLEKGTDGFKLLQQQQVRFYVCDRLFGIYLCIVFFNSFTMVAVRTTIIINFPA